MKHILFATPFVALLAGCGCDATLEVRWSPAERTLRVGESFTPQLNFYGCGDHTPVSKRVTWTAADTLIAVVDPETGRTTGRAVGTTTLRAMSSATTEWTAIPVTVTP